MDEGKTWSSLVSGPCGHFDIAAQFGLYATWNAEGSKAFSALVREMARLLDEEVHARTSRRARDLATQAHGGVKADDSAAEP